MTHIFNPLPSLNTTLVCRSLGLNCAASVELFHFSPETGVGVIVAVLVDVHKAASAVCVSLACSVLVAFELPITVNIACTVSVAFGVCVNVKVKVGVKAPATAVSVSCACSVDVALTTPTAVNIAPTVCVILGVAVDVYVTVGEYNLAICVCVALLLAAVVKTAATVCWAFAGVVVPAGAVGEIL
jgi:hypothetical protein